jgi:hypothetical protein
MLTTRIPPNDDLYPMMFLSPRKAVGIVFLTRSHIKETEEDEFRGGPVRFTI